ncbi:hypothetical protein Drorol1_Dr00014679 [Drosera rotundifolia]
MASASKAYSFTVFFLVLICLCSSVAFGYRFEVGGRRGWVKPNGLEHETYNEWAEQIRFHIGDSLYFKYHKDSVLEVSGEDYETCNVTNPIVMFDDGNTVFKLNHSKFFYFISGEPGHCEAGQRIIVRIMVQTVFHPIGVTPAPAPSPDGGGHGGHSSHISPSPAPSSAHLLLPVASCVMVSIVAVGVVLYQFMN